MDVARERRLNELAGQVLDLPPSEYRAFLEAACADDATLVDEVLSLVEHSVDLDAFLERPAVAGLAEGVPVETYGDLSGKVARIGPYRVLSILGEGGMGCVYLAEQTEPVRRQVAIKLMRSGLNGPHAVARFDAERQALARLTHPNIGQMLEAGTTEGGYPYFVMELVRGEPITTYCDREELPLDQRLDLFLKVCRGVQHAHQKQILHRDLKPSNVLVAEIDGRPTPKIIDFGIAKTLDQATDNTFSTGDRVIGTPAYMSPEALARSDGHVDPDTRTDVYSLGILLYELLTGARPFETDDASWPTILRRIAEEDAPRPSTQVSKLEDETRTAAARKRRTEAQDLRRRLSGDLDWIVLKAIAKDRQERYGSPAELAADIGRHLRHEPVDARAPSTLYLARKFVLRHRVGVAASALVLSALVLGMAGTWAGLVRAKRAEAKALDEARTAEQAIHFLVDLFEVSDPLESRGATVTAREILDGGAAKIRRELADRPLIRARLLSTIGDVYLNLGLPQEADELLAESLALRRDHGAAPRDVAASLADLAEVRRELNHLDDAEAMLGEALEICSALQEPDEVLLATVLHRKAFLNTDLEKLDRAEELYRRAIEIREREPGVDPSSLPNSWNNLGLVLTLRGDLEEAERALLRAIEIRERTQGPDHPELADSLSNLGGVYYRMGQLDQALPLLMRDLEITEKALGPDHPNLAISYNNVATLHRALGDYPRAVELYEESLRIEEGVYGTDHPHQIRTLSNLARTLRSLGDLERAESLLLRAAALSEKHRPDHEQTAKVLADLEDLRAERDR